MADKKKTKITYIDPDNTAPEVNWMGQEFKAHEAVETDDKVLIERATEHPHFRVEGAEDQPEDVKPKEKPPEPAPPPAAPPPPPQTAHPPPQPKEPAAKK